MKKFYLIASSVLAFTALSAQQNLGLENWSINQQSQTLDPVGWGAYSHENASVNVFSALGTVTNMAVSQSAEAAVGNHAAKLTTFSLTGSTSSDVPDGNYGAMMSQIFNVNQKLDNVTFQYKSSLDISEGQDTAIAFVEVYNDNGGLDNYPENVIGQGILKIVGNQDTWKDATIQINYFNMDEEPQTSRIVFCSSITEITQEGAVVPNAFIEVDDIAIQYLGEPVENVTNVVASDIGDYGDGRDLKVTFEVPANEENVASYYAIVTKPPLSPNMIGEGALVFAQEGTVIVPNGENQTHVFTADDLYWKINGSMVDSTLIEEQVQLQVWIYVEGKNGRSDAFEGSNKIILKEGTTSIAEHTKLARVFPNPASNTLNIEIDGMEDGSVVISSITGQEVFNSSIKNSVEKLDVSSLTNGMYIYTISDRKGEVIQSNKLIIRK